MYMVNPPGFELNSICLVAPISTHTLGPIIYVALALYFSIFGLTNALGLSHTLPLKFSPNFLPSIRPILQGIPEIYVSVSVMANMVSTVKGSWSME